jgi:hypothetical protein
MKGIFRSFRERIQHWLQRPRTTRPQPRLVRLTIDVLEDRVVPTTFNVNTLADISIAGGVNPNGTIVGHGNTVTLRSAIQAANEAATGNNTVNLIFAGDYKIALPGANTGTDFSGAFAILPNSHGGNLVVQNVSGGTVLVDGNHLDRVFDINPGNVNASPAFSVTLSGFTVTNGLAGPGDGADGSGGGIRDQGNVSLTLNNMAVINNSASADGGGISMENVVNTRWTLTVNNSVISNNYAGDAGGGIEEDGTGKVFINAGTVITGNTCVNQGAGIWLDAIADANNVLQTATLNVTGAVISANRALTGPGGGIGNAGNALVSITHSTISNNFSGNIGGGFADQNSLGSLVVANSLFLNNVASGNGGGIFEAGPQTSITNTQIAGNHSGAAGGGVFAAGTTLFVENSTISNNVAAGDPNTSAGGGGIELQTTGTGLNASTIINTTIVNNRAVNNTGINIVGHLGADGGGIDALYLTGDASLLNDTISANYAEVGGGVLWAGNNATFAVQNSIIAGDFAFAFPEALTLDRGFTDLGGNVVGILSTGFSAGTTQGGTTANPLNPLLAPLTNNGGPVIGAPGACQVLQTEALEVGSPAIGTGVLFRAPGFDARGRVDEINGLINVGAVSAVVAAPVLPTHTSGYTLVYQQNGTTYYNVTTTADNLNPPSSGSLSLREAINLANATPGNKVINLRVAGDYKITIPGANTGTDSSGAFVILPSDGNVTIQNASGGAAMVDGNHLDRVFDINPAADVNFDDAFTVTLSGFAITNGIAQDGDGASGSGGGIRDQGIASLTLNNDIVTGNIATADGGGLAMENIASAPWTLTINNSLISNNSAGDAGGGVETDGSGKVFINAGTVITGNTSVNQGAGVWLDAITVGNVLQSARLSVTGTIVSNNDALTAGTFGGGIGNAGNGPVSITSSTIENNFSGGDGGGFADQNGQGTLTVSSSLFLNNFAVGDGGGIDEGGPATTITNSQIQGNISGASGGGVFANGMTLTIMNCTVDNNISAGNGGGLEIATTGTNSILSNITVTGNRALNNAGTNGGGLDVENMTGALKLLNATINANFANNGGGIFWDGIGHFSVQNTIVAQNLVGNGGLGVDVNNPAGTFTDLGGNLIGVASDANTGFTAANDFTGTLAHPLNPMLGALAYNGGPIIGAPGTKLGLQTEVLLTGSKAIGKGIATGAPADDERGLPYVSGKDIGAF